MCPSCLYNAHMTIKSIARAIKQRKPAIISEKGEPRYVLLDWQRYQEWKEMEEDMEAHAKFDLAERESNGKKHYTIEEVQKKYHLL